MPDIEQLEINKYKNQIKELQLVGQLSVLKQVETDILSKYAALILNNEQDARIFMSELILEISVELVSSKNSLLLSVLMSSLTGASTFTGLKKEPDIIKLLSRRGRLTES